MSRIFGEIEQLGFVVNDAQACMEQWARLGVGPFYVFREVTAGDFLYKGAPSEGPVMTLGFAQSGNLQIEVIQQHNDVPSAYRDFLSMGREGAQHVSSWQGSAAEYDAKRSELLAEGFELVHEGSTVGGQARFAYFHSRLPGGLCIELSEARLPVLKPLIDLVTEASRNWDGRDPVREFPV